MLVLAAAHRSDVTEASRAALRATAEAGLVALQAELDASPARRVVGLVSPMARPELSPDTSSPSAILALVREQGQRLRVRTQEEMTVALLTSDGSVVAVDGPAEAMVIEAVAHPNLLANSGRSELWFSAVLRDRLHVVAMSPPEPTGHRWLAIAPLRTDAGSTFRRALGEAMPAALVQGGRLLGEPLGAENVTREQLENLAIEHQLDTPEVGASHVIETGDRRLAVLGRVPGLAGREPNPVLLVVVTASPASAGQTALPRVIAAAMTATLPPAAWSVLVGVLVLSFGLAWFLPTLEAVQPLRRLKQELEGIAVGTQAQVTREHFAGPIGEVARAAAHAIDGLRHLAPDALDFPDEDATIDPALPLPPEESAPRPTAAPPMSREDERGPVAPRPGEAHSGLRTISVGHRVPDAPLPDAVPAFERPRGRSGVAPAAALPVSNFVRSGPAEAAALPPIPMAFAPSGPAEAVDAAQLFPDASREAYYRAVFDEFLQVKVACGEPTDALTFDRFTAKLQRNEDDLRARRNDIKTVRFSVYVKDGRAALKAKVIKV